MKKEFDFLVTDSRYKHALSIVRSLGKEGFRIATCSEGFSPTKFSRYSKKSFTYNKNNFECKLLDFLKKNKVRLVLPVGYFSNIECARIKDKINNYSPIIVDNFEKILEISNKEKIIPYLLKSKIEFPKTFIIKKYSDLTLVNGKKFIIKSSEEEKGEKVNYANNKDELKRRIKERLMLGPQIVQEFIKGEGRGFFAFCKEGDILQSFQHKRIRQYPESGGVSSCAESIYDKQLEEISKKFLKKINWTGPVMLEYIYDKKEKKYYFIEMNAKFWGSYDLSVLCGLNFARIPLDIVSRKLIKQKKYEQGKIFQWVLPEDTLRIKTAIDIKKAKTEWKKDFWDPKVKKDIQYIFNDPIPTLLRIFSTMGKYLLK
jgi:predicted ATP-grasp superfamily ATP-dependent carboligase